MAIRGVGDDLSPGALALGRLLVGTAVLGVLLAGRGWVRPTRREWALLAVCGVGWFGVYNVALNAAERHLDAGTTAMLVNIGPILIAVFAGLLLGEGFPRRLLAGIAVAFAGVLLIGAATRGSGADLLGVVLCVVAAVTYAGGVVAQKPLLRRLPGLQVTFTGAAIGAVCCLPWAGVLVGDLGRASVGSIAGMVYLGVVPTALAFSTWAYALGRMDAGRLGVTTYLVPPLVIGWAGCCWTRCRRSSPSSAAWSAWSGWGCRGVARGSAVRCRCPRRPARRPDRVAVPAGRPPRTGVDPCAQSSCLRQVRPTSCRSARSTGRRRAPARCSSASLSRASTSWTLPAQRALPAPFVAGVEGVGTVVQTGDGVDDLATGQRVGWLRGGQGSYADTCWSTLRWRYPFPRSSPTMSRPPR